MRYARLSAQGDGAEHPCRAQGAYAPGCSRSRNSPTDDGGAFPPTPRHGRGTRVGSSRSAVRLVIHSPPQLSLQIVRAPWRGTGGSKTVPVPVLRSNRKYAPLTAPEVLELFVTGLRLAGLPER